MVLLVVDTQRLITNEKLYRFADVENNIKTLIAAARENRVEVIFIRHDDGIGQPLSKGNDGFEIYDGFKPLPTEKIYDKTVNSPFRDTGLLKYLNSVNEKKLITVGLQTDYCIDATIKCGFEHGFEMIVPEYTNSTFDNRFMSAEESYKYYNEFIWKNRYASCISVNETLEIIKKHN